MNRSRLLIYAGLSTIGIALSACCHGQWCFSPVTRASSPETPPPTTTDDRTGGINPRSSPTPAPDPAPAQ